MRISGLIVAATVIASAIPGAAQSPNGAVSIVIQGSASMARSAQPKQSGGCPPPPTDKIYVPQAGWGTEWIRVRYQASDTLLPPDAIPPPPVYIVDPSKRLSNGNAYAAATSVRTKVVPDGQYIVVRHHAVIVRTADADWYKAYVKAPRARKIHAICVVPVDGYGRLIEGASASPIEYVVGDVSSTEIFDAVNRHNGRNPESMRNDREWTPGPGDR